MSATEVVVIGGGLAGLATAERLAREGVAVTLLEARPRLGGRIWTVHDPASPLPIELGAEFVHGERAATWPLIREADLSSFTVPDRHHRAAGRTVEHLPQFRERLRHVLGAIDDAGDRSFREFLHDHSTNGIPPRDAELAARYVEGFHAADLDRIGTASLVTGAQAEEEDGESAFRLLNGYDGIIRHLGDRARAAGATVRLNTVATAVQWRPGSADIATRSAVGLRVTPLRARAVVVTLPLGVLKAPADAVGAVRFEPAIADKAEAARRLEMGLVARLVLRFREPWWIERAGGEDGLSFIHADHPVFRVWWTAAPTRAPLLTAWVGGPPAAEVERAGTDGPTARALDALATLFECPRARLVDALGATYHHDWLGDPFSRGAYSYAAAGSGAAHEALAAPVADTLFFAGEATDGSGRNATAQGALLSGLRVAEEVLAAI